MRATSGIAGVEPQLTRTSAHVVRTTRRESPDTRATGSSCGTGHPRGSCRGCPTGLEPLRTVHGRRGRSLVETRPSSCNGPAGWADSRSSPRRLYHRRHRLGSGISSGFSPLLRPASLGVGPYMRDRWSRGSHPAHTPSCPAGFEGSDACPPSIPPWRGLGSGSRAHGYYQKDNLTHVGCSSRSASSRSPVGSTARPRQSRRDFDTPHRADGRPSGNHSRPWSRTRTTTDCAHCCGLYSRAQRRSDRGTDRPGIEGLTWMRSPKQLSRYKGLANQRGLL
jgi:hypothetical protein